MSRMTFFPSFFYSHSRTSKNRPEPHFGAKIRKKGSKTLPKCTPGDLKNNIFPFFISMPLSAIIAVFACPGAPTSLQNPPKKQLGMDSRQKRCRHGSFVIFFRKCIKMGSRGGSRRGSANHLFATFFGLVSHVVSRGSLGRPNALQRCQNDPPGRPKRSPGSAKTIPRRGNSAISDA